MLLRLKGEMVSPAVTTPSIHVAFRSRVALPGSQRQVNLSVIELLLQDRSFRVRWFPEFVWH